MVGKRFRLGLQIDERTDTVHDESLYCRAYGHRWNMKPLSENRLRETLKNGVIEQNRWCENGCGCEWFQVLDARTFEVVTNKRSYTDGYLIKPGSGRLPRTEAKKSRFARDFPQFV